MIVGFLSEVCSSTVMSCVLDSKPGLITAAVTQASEVFSVTGLVDSDLEAEKRLFEHGLDLWLVDSAEGTA